MNSTNDSKNYATSPTPAPKTVLSSPMPNVLCDEADAELEVLASANLSLSLQAQSLSAQVVSLNALLAEKGMAEIWRHKWADLSRVATTDYIPGKYQTKTPHSDDQMLQVTLWWEPGQVLLCEGFRQTPENTLTLPLPSVRSPIHYPVQPPKPGAIPPRPPDIQGTMRGAGELLALEAYSRTWQAYLEPILTEAAREEAASQKEATQDEEELAYEAIQAIQARRLNPNPKTPRHQTIATMLQAMAEKIQERAAIRS